MGGAQSNVVSRPTAKRARANGSATRKGTFGATTHGRTRIAPANVATPRIAAAVNPVASRARRATTLTRAALEGPKNT